MIKEENSDEEQDIIKDGPWHMARSFSLLRHTAVQFMHEDIAENFVQVG